MSSSLSRGLAWLLIVVLLAGFVGAAWIVLDKRLQAGVGLPAYSSYSKDDDGLADAALLLKKLHYTTVPLTRSVMIGVQQGVLVLVQPAEQSLSDNEAVSILRWVAAGNTLLLASDHNTPLHKALGLRISGSGKDDEVQAVAPDLPGAYTRGIQSVEVRKNLYIQGDGVVPLWSVAAGKDSKEPGAVLFRHGKGRVLALADPRMLSNAGLGEAQNYLVLTNLAARDGRDGAIYFDEYHHGLQSSGGFWGYLGHHQLHLTLLPLLVLILVLVWRAMVRLGPAVALPPQTRADAIDYASALGRLYEQTGSRRLLGRTLVQGFLESLTRVLRLSPNASTAEIVAVWRQHREPTLSRLQELLRVLEDLRNGALSNRELLHWTREFDRFQREVVHGG